VLYDGTDIYIYIYIYIVERGFEGVLLLGVTF